MARPRLRPANGLCKKAVVDGFGSYLQLGIRRRLSKNLFGYGLFPAALDQLACVSRRHDAAARKMQNTLVDSSLVDLILQFRQVVLDTGSSDMI